MKKNTGMKYDPDKHHRKSIRLKHYDYSQTGAYFVTIVTQHRQHIFGDIKKGVMIPNSAGQMIESVWNSLSERFLQIELDAFVVMPNHVHGIIVINNETPSNVSVINLQSKNKTPFTSNDPVPVGAGLVPAPTPATHKHPLNKNQQTNNETAFISNDTVGASTRDAPTQMDILTSLISNEPANNSKHSTLGDVVGAFKSLTTHAYILGVRQHGWTPFDKRLWQRNYYEHIIRDDDALMKIRAYIQNNLRNWGADTENKKTGVKP